MATNVVNYNTPKVYHYDKNLDKKVLHYAYEYLMSLPYVGTIINGVMDDGKSFGAKLHMRKNFEKTGKATIFVFNSIRQVTEEIHKGKTDLVDFDETGKRFYFVKVNDFVTVGLGRKGKEKAENDPIMCEIRCITSLVKTGRETSRYNQLVWDEENYADTRINNIKMRNFKTLLSRNMLNLEKITIIGNATTMADPLLIDLDIDEIHSEGTEFDVGNQKGIFHNFKREIQDVEDKYDTSAVYQFFKQTGYDKHAFLNEYILDDLNNIVKIPDEFLNKQSIANIYKYKDMYIYHYQIKAYDQNNDFFKMRKTIKEKHKQYYKWAIDRDYLQEGIKFNLKQLSKLGRKIQMDRTYYSDVATKQALRSRIKMYLKG